MRHRISKLSFTALIWAGALVLFVSGVCLSVGAGETQTFPVVDSMPINWRLLSLADPVAPKEGEPKGRAVTVVPSKGWPASFRPYPRIVSFEYRLLGEANGPMYLKTDRTILRLPTEELPKARFRLRSLLPADLLRQAGQMDFSFGRTAALAQGVLWGEIESNTPLKAVGRMMFTQTQGHSVMMQWDTSQSTSSAKFYQLEGDIMDIAPTGDGRSAYAIGATGYLYYLERTSAENACTSTLPFRVEVGSASFVDWDDSRGLLVSGSWFPSSIWRMPPDRSGIERIADGAAAVWGPDDTILYRNGRSALWRSNTSGEQAECLLKEPLGGTNELQSCDQGEITFTPDQSALFYSYKVSNAEGAPWAWVVIDLSREKAMRIEQPYRPVTSIWRPLEKK